MDQLEGNGFLDTPYHQQKFVHPDFTADGSDRASVSFVHLGTLWFNTGSLCNITCKGCYMESSPTNDALAYINRSEVDDYLVELAQHNIDVSEIGFTGGEPFMNPEIMEILSDCLEAGFKVMVLTNAMKPLHHKKQALLALKDRFGDQLTIRVSIDHYSRDAHEELRGPNSWAPMIEGVKWLAEEGFHLNIAGRTLWDEEEARARKGYQNMFKIKGIKLDATDPVQLVLFPEMDEQADVPEITTACWGILNVKPQDMMCATSRMVIKRKGEAHPKVVPCTLLPYDPQFELSHKLGDSFGDVKLNHPHCAKFCVLGGGACSQG